MATIIACDRCGAINIQPVIGRTIVVGEFALSLDVMKNNSLVPKAEVCRACFLALMRDVVAQLREDYAPGVSA